MKNMTEKDILTLRAINHFNLDGPVYEDRTMDADYVLTRAMTRFIYDFKEEIDNNYIFIIDYRNDIYSILSYIMIINSGGIVKKNLDVRLMGTLKNSEEKQFFNGVKTINYHKAKRLDNAVIITGFHPICNVINLSVISKDFINIANPLERFLPDTFNFAKKYYIKKELEQSLEKTTTTSNEFNIASWNRFYTYPINPNNLPDDLPNFDLDIPICCFKLKGNKSDFELYDFILESSKEGNIHVYEAKSNVLNFLKNNLNPYLDVRNMVSQINVWNYTDLIKNVQDMEILHHYDTNTFKKEEVSE